MNGCDFWQGSFAVFFLCDLLTEAIVEPETNVLVGGCIVPATGPIPRDASKTDDTTVLGVNGGGPDVHLGKEGGDVGDVLVATRGEKHRVEGVTEAGQLLVGILDFLPFLESSELG